ncbi:MAG: hypothetical protein GY756_20465, partial [bacterium]|nr:hypothetical protein [bacterium]
MNKIYNSFWTRVEFTSKSESERIKIMGYKLKEYLDEHHKLPTTKKLVNYL